MKIALLFTAVALSILNPFDAFGAELTLLSPGTNEVHFEHDGVEVVLCKVKNQEHHIRRDLKDRADSIAMEFLLKHKRK
jgi:hypothetical protein